MEALGGLPLALELAKNFLNLRPELSIEMLLEEMKKSGEIEAIRIFAAQYSDELPSGHIKEVAATIELSWRLASPEAKRVLQIISLLASVPVPRRLLRRIAAFPVSSSLSDLLDQALSELAVSLSLVELDNEHEPWAHRLVSGFVRTMLEPDDELYQDVMARVNEEMARVTDKQDTKCYRTEKVNPHGEILLSFEFVTTEIKIDILNYLGWRVQFRKIPAGKKLSSNCLASFWI